MQQTSYVFDLHPTNIYACIAPTNEDAIFILKDFTHHRVKHFWLMWGNGLWIFKILSVFVSKYESIFAD